MIRDEIRNLYQNIEGCIYSTGSEGYWSNLDKKENEELVSVLEHMSTKESIEKYQPWLSVIIFSPKRGGGLELLDLSGDETCIDYGCMWGALTVALAKRCKHVLGVDQTMNSLKFLNARIREEGLENVDLLCGDLREIRNFENRFDVAVVNGVLEWIPENGPIELKKYFGKRDVKKYSGDPHEQQMLFLRKVHQNLNEKGKLYLSIENRFDFKTFLGMKDPHANVLFTSFLPRKIADLLSGLILGRPYVNWLYSFKGIDALLKEAGFSGADLYMCFPDYRFPERIIPYSSSLKDFRRTISLRNAKGQVTIKRNLAAVAEYITFKILKAKYFAPSIVAIAYK
ncbi:MAG: class I SAM-dependent methyltransferase [Proteobacteria bacterium]|nr:class I SAM-dependent methyltransferase [Pseudomonadota bacterium]